MTLYTRKYLFLFVWALLLIVAPATVISNTSLEDALKNNIQLTNFLQRITGLLAFILISIQIVLGHFMGKWTQFAGSFVFRFHIIQGIFTYLLVLIHPLLGVILTYQLSNSVTEALLFVIPRLSSQSEMYLTYGKLSFVLITLTVVAGYFRTKPFFRRNWLKLHVLNYFIFYGIYLHMRVGSDITTPPFVWLSWAALALVTYSALRKFVFPVIERYIPKNTNEIAKEKA